MEYIECPTLQQALKLGLTAEIPRRRAERSTDNNNYSSSNKVPPSKTNRSRSPESIEELELGEVFLDDDEYDDEDDDDYNDDASFA
jgi:hypothetical protein